MMEIAERFELRERIGGGVAADVHRAFDHKLGRDVVVRILRPDFAGDDEYVERFQREAEAATGIRHPNLVEVLDHGVVDDRPFLVRELVEGSTLDDLLERGALTEEEARALAEQIAGGVAAAHARGVLHRDLNAGNVFVTPDGTAKVVDFGMPSVPRHPAPEQIARALMDERTDVYGLGAVLYQMLTGHMPRGRLMPPRKLAARVSKRIENVTLRALEKDPARRYATAAAMAEALAPTAVVVPLRPLVRSRVAAAAAAVVVPLADAPAAAAQAAAAEAATREAAAAAAAAADVAAREAAREAAAREAAAAATAARDAAAREAAAADAREAAAREAADAEAAARVAEREVREAAAREAAARQAREAAAREAAAAAALRRVTRRAAAPPIAAAPAVVPIAPRLVSPAAPTERIVRPASIATPRRRRNSASPFILLVLPVLLVLLVGALTLGRPSPTNTAVLSATTTPQASAAAGVFPPPTSLPPVETTPEPTPSTERTPEPRVAPAPTRAPAPPPVAVPPPPAPAPAAPSTPAASVVRSFYELINQERFDEAAAHWSPRMQANYPPSTNIHGRFDRTRQIVIRDISPVPQNTGGATVAIDILEVLDTGVTRRWVGTWQMVWDGSRWLMDAPNLRAA